MIGIAGAMKYFNDIGVQLDEITCIAVAELCKCPAMGEFSREGFVSDGDPSSKFAPFSLAYRLHWI